MTEYRQLAIKYLMNNKKRSLYTVLGVALSVVILFTIMNFAVSYIISKRDAQRKETDYEASFLCKDKATAEEILSEPCLKSAYVEITETQEKEAAGVIVYANFRNPYRLIRYADEISRKYSVDYEISKLADYYFQDKDNNLIYTMLLTVLLISFVFGVLGVGIIRNSIQLMTLEQGRHYGILRCIGATRGQLRSMIYLMGFLLEMSGIAVGTVLGFLVYLIPARAFEVKIGFHAIVLPFIWIVFLGDLFFVMQENCKLVDKFTPVAAINGQIRIKVNQERIKPGRGKIIQKILGFEWSYAYKSLMRNPSRFGKTVGAIGLGVAMVMVSFTTNQCVNTFLTDSAKHFGYYQIYGFTAAGSLIGAPDISWDKIRKEVETLSEMEESTAITSSKPVYAAALHTANRWELTEHYSEEYANDSYYAFLEKQQTKVLSENKIKDISGFYQAVRCSEITLFGYEEEDYRSLKKELAEGTLELSENGILLVNHTYSPSVRTDLYGNIMTDYTVTDYRVGDEIVFVDIQSYYELLEQRMNEKAADTSGNELLKEYIEVCYEVYQELLEQGATKTYIIEGILNKDTVLDGIIADRVHFVLPLERYFQDTGLTKDKISGRMFHMKGIHADAGLKTFCEKYEEDSLSDEEAGEKLLWCNLDYVYEVQNIDRLRNVILAAVYFALFIVGVNILNIMNVTAGNLYSRHMEFAQLRILGMSVRRLRKTVLLEGIITGLTANAVGLLLGAGISRLAVWFMNLMIFVEYHFPWRAYCVTAAVVFLIICGSVYRNFKDLPPDISEELS
ncbi:MAG: ABC transporter permease [Acetatifactor sp.]